MPGLISPFTGQHLHSQENKVEYTLGRLEFLVDNYFRKNMDDNRNRTNRRPH